MRTALAALVLTLATPLPLAAQTSPARATGRATALDRYVAAACRAARTQVRGCRRLR